eukprot:g1900.t1
MSSESTEEMKNIMLMIDPQVDFHPGGSLPIPGADEDATRIAAFIKKNINSISEIIISLDSHHPLHIAHPSYWIKYQESTAEKDKKREHPDPYTAISAADVGVKWETTRPQDRDWGKTYCEKLESSENQLTLMVWPEHCLVGTPGHAVYPTIAKAVNQWARHNLSHVQFCQKGLVERTEMYSIFQAEVVLPDHPSTAFNKTLFQNLSRNPDKTRVFLTGQALSHCVNYSVRHLVSKWPKENLKNLVLLSDTMSPAKGFAKTGESFLEDMKAQGVTVATTKDFTF